MNIKKFLLMAAAVVSFAACDKNNGGGDEPLNGSFDIKVAEMTPNSCVLNITPSDNETQYMVFLMTEKEVEGTADADLQKYILNFIKQNNMDITKLYKKGPQEIKENWVMFSNSTYYAVVFGYNGSRRTTPISRVKMQSKEHNFDTTGTVTLTIKVNDIIQSSNETVVAKTEVAPGADVKYMCFTSYDKKDFTFADDKAKYADIYDKSVVLGSQGKVGFYLAGDKTANIELNALMGSTVVYAAFPIDKDGKFGKIVTLEHKMDLK